MVGLDISKILGYGEDALTLWALKHHVTDTLKKFENQSASSDCLIFYRSVLAEEEE